ncbi:MAG: DUF4405 domain-containing protein [Opitutales bacterium]|nr:DUF4405 domain-containing protein [Opitutales bacterium]
MKKKLPLYRAAEVARGDESRLESRGHSFNWRGFASLGSACAFLILFVSGTVLYVAPRGRVANWTDWTVLGLDKEEWSDLHMAAAILFLAVVALHILFNWRVLVKYICSRADRSRVRLRELLTVCVMTVAVAAGTIGGLPPFSAVEKVNTAIKDYWEKDSADRVTRAPSTWVQEANLPSFAAWAGVSFADMMNAFEEAGYPVEDPMMSISEFARQYRVSPETLFALARSRHTSAPN